MLTLLRSRPVYQAPLSIPSVPAGNTPTVDSTLAVQNWLATIPDGAAAKFGSGAVYGYATGNNLFPSVDGGAYQLLNRNNLILDGNGCTFQAITQGNAFRSTFNAQLGSGLTFLNMTIIGAIGIGSSSGQETQTPIVLHSVAGCRVEGCTLQDSYGYFINCVDNQLAAGPPTTNVIVDNCVLQRNNAQGIALVCVDGFVMLNSTMLRGAQVNANFIDIESANAAQVTQNITIGRIGAGNTFGDPAHGGAQFSALAIGGYIGQAPNTVGNIVFQGNTVYPTFETSQPGLIQRTTFKGNIPGFVVDTNTFNLTLGAIPVALIQNMNGFAFTNNTIISQAANVGGQIVAVIGNTGGTVTGNTLTLNAGSYTHGIWDSNAAAYPGSNSGITESGNTNWPSP